MLKSLRKKGVSKKIIWFIAIIIIISFGFLGTAYLIAGRTSNSAGKIFGKKISLETFSKNYEFVRVQAMMRYGEKFQDVQEHLDLAGETWDRLVLLHEARKRNIKIPDTEVIRTIEQYAIFQRNGQFDTLIYNDVLRFALRMNARDFEERIRDSLKLSRLYNMETETVSVPEEEIYAAYNTLNEKVQVSYVVISPDTLMESVPVPDEEIEQYFTAHQSQFEVPESVNVQYIQFDFPDVDTDNQETDTEETAEIANQREEKKQSVRDQSLELYQKLQDNPNMGKIAAENNAQVKETGFFSKENPPLSLGWSFDLLNYVFDLDKEIISGPFESTNGIQIVEVIDRKEAYIPRLEDVKDAVAKALRREKAMGLAKTKAQEILPAIKEEYSQSPLHDFTKIAKSLDLNVDQTPLFSRGQYIPKIGISNDFQSVAFSLNEENKISEVVESSTGYYILHLDTYEAAGDENYTGQRDEIAARLLMEKKNAVFNNFYARLKGSARLVDNISRERPTTPPTP